MARDVFDFYDGEIRRDTERADCAGREQVRNAAMLTLPAIAERMVPQDGDTQTYKVRVRNEKNITVYTATLTYAGLWLGENVPPTEESTL